MILQETMIMWKSYSQFVFMICLPSKEHIKTIKNRFQKTGFLNMSTTTFKKGIFNANQTKKH